MAQGQFTKEEAERTAETVKELFNAIPKNRRLKWIGELNDIFLFIDAAKAEAPDEKDLVKAEGVD